MAKIKDYKQIVLGNETVFPISVNSKGRFSTTYPASIMQTVKFTNDFASLAELHEEISRVIREVESQQTTIEYLLAYKVKGKFSERNSTPGASLEIIYTLYQKTTIGTQTTYNYIDYDTFNSNSDNWIIPNYYTLGNRWQGINGLGGANPEKDNILPLTIDNIRFFEELCKQLNDIRKRLEDFTKEPENLQKTISSKAPLLLNGENDNEK